MKLNFIQKILAVALFAIGVFFVPYTIFAQVDYGNYGSSVDYGSYSSDINYGTYTSGVDYGTYTSNPNYGTYTSGVDYGTYTSSPNYGTYTSGVDYGTYTSNVDYGTYTSNPNYGTYTSNVDYGTNNTNGTGYGTYTSNNGGYGTYTSNTNPNTYTPGSTYIPSPTYIPGSYAGGGSNGGGVSYVGGGSNGGGVSYVGGNYSGSVSYPGNTNTGSIVTSIVCPNGSNLINGQCINTITGTVITTTVCPAGTTSSGSNCINTINGNIVTNIVCTSGALINGQCVNTVNGNVVTNVVCTSGNLINGQCVNTITPPVTTVTSCPSNTQYINGTCRQIINAPVITYQTCWDGQVIPATSQCAPQYKICANGTSVPVNQACYVTTTPVYTPPQVVKFNNVVTSPVTQITNTQGRCNGIGLIANNAQSTGWFEYGETANLGRTTASANIGSSVTAPFSNVLASLKPSTRYFCRAVMQNQYGIVKGEIVSFVTKSKVTTYVKPVAKPPVKKPVKTDVITCSDGSTIKASNASAATLINQGEKLLALQIEKVEGTLTSDAKVHYKITYKNLTDTRLTGVVVKINLPQEIIFTSTDVGTYDGGTRTLTLNQDTIDPYTEGTIVVTGTVMSNAPLGKTVVTNVYAVYTVPGTKTQDEVTAYVIGSIVPTVDISSKDTGAKKVIGVASSTNSFMPGSLIEWLALIAIFFIIFILGRSIYASYKEDEGAKH